MDQHDLTDDEMDALLDMLLGPACRNTEEIEIVKRNQQEGFIWDDDESGVGLLADDNDDQPRCRCGAPITPPLVDCCLRCAKMLKRKMSRTNHIWHFND